MTQFQAHRSMKGIHKNDVDNSVSILIIGRNISTSNLICSSSHVSKLSFNT